MKLRSLTIGALVGVAALLTPAAVAAPDPDTDAPVVHFNPAVKFRLGNYNPYGGAPFQVGWQMADLSGICYQSGDADNGEDSAGTIDAPPLQFHLDGGVITDPAVFSVRMKLRDCSPAKNEGNYTASWRMNAPQDDQAGTYDSATSWKTSTCTCFQRGTDRNSTVVGATVTYKYAGNSVALVAPKAPGRGKAQVLIDGNDRGVVDFSNPTPLNHQIVYSYYQDTTAVHTMTVKVLSGRVDIDGFLSD